MAQSIQIHRNGDGCWPDIAQIAEEGKLECIGNGINIQFAPLAKGMNTGRTSLTMRVDYDGRTMLIEMALDNFLAVASFYQTMKDMGELP